MQVQDVMTRSVISLSPETLVEDAARILVRARISGAPVMGRDNRPAGIVSLVDLVDPERTARRVGELDRRQLVTTGPTVSLAEAAAAMIDAGVRRMPVLDGSGHMIGIVSGSDLLRGLARVAR